MQQENSLRWLGTYMIWISIGVPPITFLLSGGNGTSSSTSTGLPKSGCQSCGSTNHPSDACSLSPCRSRDALPNLTCAKTLTKADPVLALHALTNRGVTSPDAQQPTLWKTTQQRGISQIHDHWKEESGFKKPEVASSKYSDNNNFLPLVAISFVNYCSNLGFFFAQNGH